VDPRRWIRNGKTIMPRPFAGSFVMAWISLWLTFLSMWRGLG
jgi:hypothetical protein